MTLAPGATLGPYDILAPISAGGMGEVYRGRDPRLQRDVAVKILKAGQPIDEATWQARQDEWLPSDADRAYVLSLMKPVTEPGKIAGWIAPPPKGINSLPFETEYVQL